MKSVNRVKTTTINLLPARLLDYFAGLFDGEGTVTWGVSSLIGSAGKRCLSVRPIVQFNSTTYKVLEPLIDEFRSHGFHWGRSFHKARKANHNPSITWTLTGRKELEALLEQLIPSLRIKKQQAQLCLLALRLRPSHSKGVTKEFLDAVDTARWCSQRGGETCRSVWSVLKDCPATMVIPCQAEAASTPSEGVETKSESANDNLAHERAAPVHSG